MVYWVSLPHLVHNSRVNGGLTAAQIQGRRAGEKIDIAVSVLIIDHVLLCLCDNKRKIGKVGTRRDDLFVPFDPLHTILDRWLHTLSSRRFIFTKFIYFYL